MNQTPDELFNTADALERLADNDERTADEIVKQFDIKETDYPKIKNTVYEFVSDYVHKDKETTDKQFLVKKFNGYPQLWKDKAEIEQTADEIVGTVYTYEKNKQELDAHIASGKRRESWLAIKIEQGSAASGNKQVGTYAQKLDMSIDNANKQMERTIHNIDGSINHNPNLDGFIAEQHHANTFNLDAAQKEKAFSAEPLSSNGKNSVDVVVRDSQGRIKQKYQSKYGKDAETTESYFANGNYRGQRKLVPEGQGKDIYGSSEKIELTKPKNSEKIESKPLSKEQAKVMQKKAQSEGKVDDYTWNNFTKGTIAKRICRKAGLAALFAVGLQGARIVGRRIWNWATGKENQSVAEDVKEFAESAIKSGASAGLTVATSGALTVAARSGWLGKLLMKTPAGHLAAAACVGIENAKVLYKYAKGEITGEQALDQAGRATCSVVGGLAGSVKGASIGAAIGTVLGPVGSVVGGVAGGLVGGIAGSVVGEAIFSAGKKIVKTVANGIKAVGYAIASGAKKIFSGLKTLFS